MQRILERLPEKSVNLDSRTDATPSHFFANFSRYAITATALAAGSSSTLLLFPACEMGHTIQVLNQIGSVRELEPPTTRLLQQPRSAS